MELNGLSAGMYPNMGPSPRMQGLEMSLQHHHHHLPQIPTTQIAAAAAAAVYPHPNRDYDHQQQQQHQHPGLTQFPGMQDYSSFAARPKTQTFTLSDDDEQGQTVSNSADDGRRTATSSSSPWQRMKWTDDMIRLLIMVVYCIGDHEVSCDDHHPSAGAGIKKKNSAVLQKKGKWKSVSMAMMHKGFSVSPQQCEDKFNDLNKRYKRVNDILGKGTACKVVEDHSLLDTMDLPPKLKDEVKKLLNSKHLFFKDMCNYHTSLARSATGAAGGSTQLSPDSITQQLNTLQQHPHSQRPMRQDDDEEDGDSDEEIDDDWETPSKRQRIGGGVGDGQVTLWAPPVQDFSIELKNVLQDETKTQSEKRRWMKAKMMQLEEQRVGYESEGLELKIQRFKWMKYKNDKERELESDKLILERKKLENERMMLLIRHKEFDMVNGNQLVHQNRQSSSRSD